MTDKQIQDHCNKGLHNETNIVMEVRPIPFSIAGYYVTIKCNRCGKVFIKEKLTNYTEYIDRTNLFNNKLKEALKAKEQECEELKNDNLQEVGQLKFAIGTLTAENLHLKELLDMRIEALCDSCKAGSMLPIKCRIYEKTLTEIKNKLTVHKTLYYESKLIEKLHKQILQKISECEVE